jgi:hypothetical protein
LSYRPANGFRTTSAPACPAGLDVLQLCGASDSRSAIETSISALRACSNSSCDRRAATAAIEASISALRACSNSCARRAATAAIEASISALRSCSNLSWAASAAFATNFIQYLLRSRSSDTRYNIHPLCQAHRPDAEEVAAMASSYPLAVLGVFFALAPFQGVTKVRQDTIAAARACRWPPSRILRPTSSEYARRYQ